MITKFQKMLIKLKGTLGNEAHIINIYSILDRYLVGADEYLFDPIRIKKLSLQTIMGLGYLILFKR